MKSFDKREDESSHRKDLSSSSNRSASIDYQPVAKEKTKKKKVQIVNSDVDCSEPCWSGQGSPGRNRLEPGDKNEEDESRCDDRP